MTKLTLPQLRAAVQQREAAAAADVAAAVVEPLPAVVTPDGRPCWYPADAILTVDEVAVLLGCAVKTVRRRGIRHRDGCYLYRDVVAYLTEAA